MERVDDFEELLAGTQEEEEEAQGKTAAWGWNIAAGHIGSAPSERSWARCGQNRF